MSVNRRHGTIIFHCDICGVRRLDQINGDSLHAVTRLTFVRARKDGWHLRKQYGKRETICPDCASIGGYSLPSKEPTTEISNCGTTRSHVRCAVWA
jgi:hypothetical protein